ncbi:hypothetical protein [Acinetobacter bereziniae]|uniref:hypothetical protein n=1 Tax=Acinetobacter bereziniae TaxID=106648 RepID=UPI00124FBAEC|nr:hypothetical protein [Acinetobacter bereziniae]
MTQISREQLIELFRKAQFTDQQRSQGRITVDSPSLVTNLTLAFDDEETGWHATSLPPVIINQTYNFHYNGVVTSKFGHVFKSVEGLFKNSYFRGSCEKKYYIIELNFDKYDLNKPPIIKKYEKLINFIKLLKTAAIFSDSSISKMLFLNDKDNLEIEPIYLKNDVDQLNETAIDNIIKFIEDNTHSKQKLAILSKAIIAECKNETFDKRFTALLTKLDDIYNTLEHDYAVFASSFSYEKLRNEIENAKLEEQVKIHKVITDIQNQILGIPVATVIVATQFKTQKSVNCDYVYQFAVNTGITIGVCIFTFFMGYLVYNQIQSLTGIRKEIQRKDERFKSESPIVYNNIKVSTNKEPFQDLFDRLDTQNIILWVIIVISILACIATIVIYSYITVNPYSN